MLEAVHTDLVFTISLKRSTQNLQLSTSCSADYPIFRSMLLKKAKMNRSKFLPVRPSKPVFRNPTHHRELTKATGWKSHLLYVHYIIFGLPHRFL